LLDENAFRSEVSNNKHIIIKVLFILLESRIFVLDMSMRDVTSKLKLIRSVDIGSHTLSVDRILVEGYMENSDIRVNIDSVLHNHHHLFDCLNIMV
jgi:hypothetical protein